MIKKLVFDINKEGFIKEIYVARVENNIILDDLKKGLIPISPPNGLFKPKWTGTEWIEGATQEEIDELTKVEPSPPSSEERINALEEALLLMMMEG